MMGGMAQAANITSSGLVNQRECMEESTKRLNVWRSKQ